MMNPIKQYQETNTCSLEAIAERAQISFTSVYNYSHATPERARKMSLETCDKFKKIGIDFMPFIYQESIQN